MENYDQVELSLVTPGYNEEERISDILMEMKNALVNYFGKSWELIFVNDGSTDNTAGIVSGLSKSDPRINYFSYKNNRGRGYALRQGIAKARGNYILTTESDLSWGTEIFKKLYDKIKEENCDIVVVNPYARDGESRNAPISRVLLSRWGNKLLSASVDADIKMLTGMTRIYSKKCINSLPLVSNDKEIHLEIISKAIILGYSVIEIPGTCVWPEKHIQKISKRESSFITKKYIISHLSFSFFERPLMLFGLLGGLSLIGGFLVGLYITYLRYAGLLNPNRPLMTLVVLMVLGGILLISFGLIGMQINEIRKEIIRIQSELNK